MRFMELYYMYMHTLFQVICMYMHSNKIVGKNINILQSANTEI